MKDEETGGYTAQERRNAYRLRWENVIQMNPGRTLIFCLFIPILTQKNLAHSLYEEYSRPNLISCFTLCQGNPGGSASFAAKNVLQCR